jgi:L-malate glycosyltransferase
MRLLVITEDYPHEGNLPGNMFVHVRVKEYLRKHEVQVLSPGGENRTYEFEGVKVESLAEYESVFQRAKAYNPDRILIHIFQPWMLDGLVRRLRQPFVIWVHGYEAMGWYRRLYNVNILPKDFLLTVYLNMLQQLGFRKLLSEAKHTERIRFVFVSNWIKNVVQLDALSSIPRYAIIPNPIDTVLFHYSPKQPDQRFRILLLRSFRSKKYANDWSVHAILALSRSKHFSQFQFTVVGEGSLFAPLTAPLREFRNVRLQEGLIAHAEIPKLHDQHGIFLCPTRQDTHGVSMCEAMSSGLVPLTSNNSAIPEYVQHGKSGWLTKTAKEIAIAMETLAGDDTLFQSLSRGASEYVRAKCGIDHIIKKELHYIETAN